VKVSGKAFHTQRIEGTITETDLLALVRETFHIPEEAHAEFWANGDDEECLVTVKHPLTFTITWSLPDGPSEQG
jgi:hypothetical protein